ncbi:hypothetical protein [Hymenobacter chitinivorans]|uniref:Uncharacterized protein n=1 Tax=Hymenobacter chitinivorans DSM 11115 TaxID=1121954 RepID=A0A2M9AS65_9BACT|nr:hypothetical protein [Hymenobacter chitinivorans]PJJ48538.1 hypothetical protein CLV45_4247 [Hymenobacter chitinivorans DSM 11115]
MDYHHAALAREAELEQVRLATEHALRTDPRYQPYFAGYTPASIEAFIQHYARHKVSCLEQGPGMVKFRLHQVIEYQEEAYERLFDVQRKKLFDLQVRWRAGEITLPGVQTYQQFEAWQRNGIHRCPFLPPITRAEYELYRDWLASDACQEFANHQDYYRNDSEWQDYNAMRAEWVRAQAPPTPPTEENKRQEYIEYPAWFAYYDARTGTPAGYPFATHSNRRGELQDHYMDLAREERWALNPPKPYVPDPRPDVMNLHNEPDAFADAPDRYLTEDDWHFAEFTRRFDPDPETLLAYRRAMLCVYNGNYNNVLSHTSQNLELLADARGPWPVPTHADWRQGIYAAAARLHRELLLAALPAVFEDYEFRLQAGLQPAPPDEYRAYHDDKPAEDPAKECRIMPYLKEGILRGRELAGEPRNFNY